MESVSHSDPFEASDLVSDWLIQTCCKKDAKSTRTLRCAAAGRFKRNALALCLQQSHMGLRYQNLAALHYLIHDAKESMLVCSPCKDCLLDACLTVPATC